MKAKTKQKHASPLQKVRIPQFVLCDPSADMACKSASWLTFLTFTCTSHPIYQLHPENALTPSSMGPAITSTGLKRSHRDGEPNALAMAVGLLISCCQIIPSDAS